MSNNYKGVTLVELLLYMALFSTVILTMVQFFVFVSNKNVDARNRIELSRSVIFIREHFGQLEPSITSFDDANSIYDNDSGKITVATSSGNRSYTLQNGNILFNNGSSNVDLLASGVLSTKLRFTKIVDGTNQTIGVHVYISMTHVNIVNHSEEFDFIILSK